MPLRNTLTSLDLNLLPILLAVLEERHVTNAAVRLGISQPAVSKAIGKLRTYFQDELMVRNGSGYELTVTGNKLLASLVEIMPRLKEALDDPPFDPGSAIRTFTVSASDFTVTMLLPPLAKIVSKTKLKIVFCTSPSDTLSLVNTAKIDLFLTEAPPPLGCSSQELLTSGIKCLVNRHNPVKNGKFTLDEYLQQTHIRLSGHASSRSVIDMHLASHGVSRFFNIATSCMLPAAYAVALTDCVVAVPEPMAEAIAQATGTRVVDPPDEVGRFRMHLVWNPVHDADEGHKWLRQTMLRLYKEALQEFGPAPD